MSRRQQGKQQQAAEAQAYEQQQQQAQIDAAAAAAVAAQQPAPAPAAAEDDTIAQLTKLGELKAQGILTEEEFAAQKAKVLGG